MRVEIAVRTPTITDDRSAGLDPCIYNGLQSVSGSVWNGSEKRFNGLALNTAKHPTPLNRVAFMTFGPTELALDGLVRPADLLRAALHVHQHGLSAELAPVRDRIWTEAMLFLGKAGRDAAHDVRIITSWRERLQCRNHEPCFVDLDSEYTATALLRRPIPNRPCV